MKKRLLSLLMAVLMAALLLPVEAFAITGGDVRRLYMDTAPVTITKEGIDSGSQIYSMKMKNGRLVMFIATSGPPHGQVRDQLRPGLYRHGGFLPQRRV